MSNESPISPFPNTRQDLSDLKQTALDAANDLGSAARVHASKAQGHLHDLAGHVQEEGREQLENVKGKLNNLVNAARDYVEERPFMTIGAALTLGFLLGFNRRRSHSQS